MDNEYLPAISESQAVISQLERMVRDPSIDVAKVESLYRMMQEERHHAEVIAFNQAMRRCQLEMLPVVRDAENTHIGNRYAKLETIDGLMRPIYTRHGFSVRYGSAVCPKPEWQRITCTVSHDDGHFETHFLDAPPDATGNRGAQNKTGAQAVGSTVTYLRRYLQTMVFNIVMADDIFDDDGEGSRDKGKGANKTNGAHNRNWLAPLDEQDGRQWLLNVKQLLADATELRQVNAIETHRNVQIMLRTGSAKVQQWIRDQIEAAKERLQFDPLEEFRPLLAAMTLDDLRYLNNNAKWTKLRANLLPPDEDALHDLVEQRRAELSQEGKGNGEDVQRKMMDDFDRGEALRKQEEADPAPPESTP